MAVWDPLGLTTGSPDYGQLFGGPIAFLGEILTGSAGQESGIGGGVITPEEENPTTMGTILGIVQQVLPLILIGAAVWLLIKYGAKLLK